jgi:hypothetical protein
MTEEEAQPDDETKGSRVSAQSENRFHPRNPFQTVNAHT